MQLLQSFLDLFLHLDTRLSSIIQGWGALTYGLLFLVVFCETGLVVTPFLPGDSLLFAAGSFAAQGALDPHVLFALLSVAAIGGDTANYWAGSLVGPRVFRQNLRFLKREHLEKTQKFYEKYGAKTIVLARFVPIVRTFAPFVAGVGTMRYRTFLIYNITGGLLWVALFVYGGYFFGNIPVVKENFEIVILGIIVVSVLPGIIEFIRQRPQRHSSG